MNDALPISAELDFRLAFLAAPLAPGFVDSSHQAFVARAIGELLHERLLDAEVSPLAGDSVRLVLRAREPGVTWTCVARRRQLDFFSVVPGSVVRVAPDAESRPGLVAALFLDFAERIGIEPFTLARFLEEANQTLYADASLRAKGRVPSRVLAESDAQTLEQAMEGHPWILVNKGRIGFGADAQRAFAPESGASQRLVWFAARKDAARFYGAYGLTHDALYTRELAGEHAVLRGRLAARGLDPDGYLLLPANEWQTTQKLFVQFAREIADGRLVLLGTSASTYFPQQSIRTYRHATRKEACFVKTSLSILNTGQIRGLSPVKLARAPRVTEWLRARFASDPVFERLGTIVLGEIATVVYEHPAYRCVPNAPYQYQEMLGVLFRESAEPRLARGESLATMASLLYVDDDGSALVAAFARRAGLSMEAWLRAYLNAYLQPLLHSFYAHETYLVAHGENTVLVLDEGRPTRVVLKDLVEEIQVSRRVRATLPDELRTLFYEIDDALLPLFLLTDVVDGFFRYLGDVLATYCDFAESRFYRIVAETILTYEHAHPELAAAFAEVDLFVPTFPRFCLNKYRLVLFGYADTADNTVDTDPKFDGVLPNPLAPFAPPSRRP